MTSKAIPPTTSNLTKNNSLILVVDDDRGQRRLMRYAMEQEGYRVIEAANGEECLEYFQKLSPDLVLLDAVMPVLNGFETCQELQKITKKPPVPVLMVTALEDKASVDEAFQVGATDYITKPIHWPVLRQRVRRLLLQRQNEQLRDDLIHMIVHDMKNPLGAIRGTMELFLEGMLGSTEAEQHEALLRCYRSSEQLLDMTLMILDTQRLEEGKLNLQLTPAYLQEVLEQIKSELDWLAQQYNSELMVSVQAAELAAKLDWNLIQRVLANLVSNALKHSYSSDVVKVSAEQSASGELHITVKDEGAGIAPEDQLRIFERYTQAGTECQQRNSFNTGLGLTFCKLAVEAQGGRIELTSTPGAGATFTLVFPSEVIL